MKDHLEKSLGIGSLPDALDGLKDHIAFNSSEEVLIFKPKLGVDFAQDLHCHEDYEFFIPLHAHFPMQLEKTVINIPPTNVFNLNPQQIHGAALPTTKSHIISIFIKRDFLKRTHELIYGSQNIDFKNGSHRVNCDFESLINIFISEYANKQTGYEFILESLSVQLTVYLIRNLKNTFSENTMVSKYKDNNGINAAIGFLREHYNQEFSLKEVARVANYSSYHFLRVFKSQTGKTPFEYLINIKIEKAVEMLKDNKQTITEICYSCGFNNISHFTTVFKKKIGVSPSEYRKSLCSVLKDRGDFKK